PPLCLHFRFNAPPTTLLYTLSLHDALPISPRAPHHELHTIARAEGGNDGRGVLRRTAEDRDDARGPAHPPGLPQAVRCATRRSRSEEHTSELQSPYDLVCRLLLEKKKP